MNFEQPPLNHEQREMTLEKLREIFKHIVDSEFQIKEGRETARPIVRKLYAMKGLREKLLNSDDASGEIEIMGVTFEVVTGRTKPNGEMASIIHKSAQGLVKRYLLKKEGIPESEMNIEIPPLVEVQTGKFNTSSGDLSPKKDTIYATALLRTILGVEKGGEIEINGVTFAVKSGRRLNENDSFTNYTTGSQKAMVEKYVEELFDQMYEN